MGLLKLFNLRYRVKLYCPDIRIFTLQCECHFLVQMIELWEHFWFLSSTLDTKPQFFFWNSILNCTLFLSEVRKLFNMFWSLWHDHHEWLALKYIFIWNEFHIKLENSYIDNSRNCFVNNRKNSKLITLFIEVNECNLNVFIQRGAAKRATKKKSLVADNEEPVSKINYLNQL